jgi:acylphosphatase
MGTAKNATKSFIMNQFLSALITVIGDVQGVAYRYNAMKEAKAISLTGYAKNMADGSVEILAQGEKAEIEAFIEWCKAGPSQARVKDIKISWELHAEKRDSFEVL